MGAVLFCVGDGCDAEISAEVGGLARLAPWMCDRCQCQARATVADVDPRAHQRSVLGEVLPPYDCPKSAAPPTSAAERFNILQWAGSRPGVLSLLRALREKNYDETGTEYLARVVGDAAIPAAARRLSLVGSVLDGDSPSSLLECSCTFVHVGTRESWGDTKASMLYERESMGDCEVHGVAASSTHPGPDPA